MNAFYEHHKDNIRFNYRCFDRILLNGLIQPFQQPERVNRLLRHLSPAVPGEPGRSARHRRAVPQLGQEPLGKVGRTDFGSSPRPTRRIRRALL